MNTASQPDTPSEWSKFSPLPPRLRSQTALSERDPLAAADPSSVSANVDACSASDSPAVSNPTDSPDPAAATVLDGDVNASASLDSALERFPDHFLCHNRKCEERRERRNQAPRHLFTALWRSMKLGKRHVLVLDLTIACPDCGFEHHATLVPPEWQDVPK